MTPTRQALFETLHAAQARLLLRLAAEEPDAAAVDDLQREITGLDASLRALPGEPADPALRAATAETLRLAQALADAGLAARDRVQALVHDDDRRATALRGYQQTSADAARYIDRQR